MYRNNLVLEGNNNYLGTHKVYNKFNDKFVYNILYVYLHAHKHNN